jgi:two-component system chemotaxis response regulator CheB
MNRPHAIVIGASAGGVAALLELAGALPPDLPAVLGVVLHVGSTHSILPALLTARGSLPAVHPRDGEPLRAGTIYVAPPDHHLLFTPEVARLSRGPRENYARPAIDPLFRTAALHWRERAIGVVLTGELDDGTAGLQAIKECGGIAIVQDPAEALQASMPASALANVAVDHCLPIAGIAAQLQQLVAAAPAPEPASAAASEPAATAVAEHLQHEQEIFEGNKAMEHLGAVATPSTLTCPDCGGSLWELKDSKPLRYRCHTGHAFTAGTLQHAQKQTAEHSLWSSVRALRERELLLRRLATVAQATGDPAQAEVGRRQADRVKAQAEQLASLATSDEVKGA